ncbi:MAG: hypothetical protein JXB23_04900 [Candidatus Aminicenantes bacterium]|nr:hypothetical protein [Candidatus Aminicenantes bacterium]
MIELPEASTIGRQLEETIKGKRILECDMGKSDRKWVFFGPSKEIVKNHLMKKTVGKITSAGRSIHIGLMPDQAIVMDEFGGKVLYHNPDAKLPKKYDLIIEFEDHSCLTVVIQMWGFISTYEQWKKNKWVIIRANALSPVDAAFSLKKFNDFIDQYEDKEKESIKTFFTNGKSIAGIGNGYLQDILFRAKISPKRKVGNITPEEAKALYKAVKETIRQAISENGRTSERDLFDKPGNYSPIMDKSAIGKPCLNCGTAIKKISYLGGSCYICPNCQR